eukprot:SAG31_NODE_9_length_42330_cov_441.979162_20_plen_490_part_00
MVPAADEPPAYAGVDREETLGMEGRAMGGSDNGRGRGGGGEERAARARAAGGGGITGFLVPKPTAAMWASPSARAPPPGRGVRRGGRGPRRAGGARRGRRSGRGRGGRRGAEEARGGTAGEDRSGETRELSELSSGALAGRFLEDLTTGGLANKKLRLTSSSQRQQMKEDTVSLAFWNCNRLSVELMDYLVGSQDGAVKGLGYDLLGLAELHGDEQLIKDLWGSDRMIVGDPPPEDGSDPASGVAIILSPRLRRALRDSGCHGSRIVWAKFAADPVSVYVVVGYVPHIGRSQRPFAADFWRDLRAFWNTLPARAAKILMLDANGRMARAAAGGAGGDVGGVGSGVTGRWSLYKESDNELGAMLRQFCEDEELVAVSTKFKPKQKYGGAGTFQPYGRQSLKARAQIDYMVCSKSFESSCLNVKARWGPSERRWKLASGQKKDHAMLVMHWRMRMQCPKREQQPDTSVLKTEDGASSAMALQALSSTSFSI